jgi:hypothetical protein
MLAFASRSHRGRRQDASSSEVGKTAHALVRRWARPASIEHGAPSIGYAVDALKMLVTFALFAGVIGLMFQIGNQIIGRRK